MLAALIAALAAASAHAATIVDEGEARAAIVLPAEASDTLQEAAALLADYIEQSSGAAIPVIAEGALPPEDATLIHLGPTSAAAPVIANFGDLADDGFVIRASGGDEVIIAGPTDAGIAFGVYEFLERYVGVRWLLPGEHGTSVPRRATIEVPDADIRQEPAFFSRKFSGLVTGDERTWIRHMRMSSRMRFHHNLRNLFPPETWAATHPEFFPLIDGERRLPTSNGDYKWTPCFSAPGIVAEAARVISEHFDAIPAAESYSLGINDVGTPGWCQCSDCRAAYSGETNFVGVPDYSDPYYAWCGEVIDAVLEQHPDKWFGCLAYNNAIDPPSGAPVHPRLIPYITLDRMQWADPALRERGHEFNARWESAASTLGWYDYIYGRQYSLPRVYCHQMAENLRYARDHGVTAFYAEAYPNWGEGPKLYVAARLLWNPDADVDEMLRDWYVACAGEAAADDLARYYAHWEDFWTRRVLASAWFGGGQILGFNSQRYLDEVTLAEMAQCRGWLESALAKTETADQRARVGELLAAFEGYEDALLHYRVNGSDAPAQMLGEFLAGAAAGPQLAKARALLDVLEGRVEPHSRNASFETGEDETPHNWMLWVKPLGDPPHGTMQWTETDEARTGGHCLVIEGLKRGGPVQAIAAPPGRYVMVAAYRLHQPIERNRLELSTILKDSANRELSFGMQSNAIFVDMHVGGWRIATRPFVVPEQVGGTPVAYVQVAAIIEYMKPGERIDLDDIAIYRVGD